MAIVGIPVTNQVPNYRFQIDLESVQYYLEFRFNTRLDRWVMDIEDKDKNTLIQGVPILINLNLLAQYVIEGLPPGVFMAINETGTQQEATRNTFGVDVKLIYITSDEVETIGSIIST